MKPNDLKNTMPYKVGDTALFCVQKKKKKRKEKQRKKRKSFKAETIKRLSPRPKCYYFTHSRAIPWWPTILFSVPRLSPYGNPFCRPCLNDIGNIK